MQNRFNHGNRGRVNKAKIKNTSLSERRRDSKSFPSLGIGKLTADLDEQGLPTAARSKVELPLHSPPPSPPRCGVGEWDRLYYERGDIPHGTLANATNQPEGSSTDAFGLTVCNVPIGTDSFVRG